MQLPNLQEQVALWQRAYRKTDWVIESRYVDDLVHPETKQPVYGLCTITNYDDRRALLEICTPKTEQDLCEMKDTIIHEMTHVLLRGEEEHIAWTLAPLLAYLEQNDPSALRAYVESLPWGTPSLARIAVRDAAAPKKTLLAARVRARAGGKTVDITKLLISMCESLMAMSDMPDEAKTIIQNTLDAAKGEVPGEEMADPLLAAMTDEEKALAAKTATKTEEEPAVAAKARAEAKREAAKVLVEALPLSPEAKAYAATLASPADVQTYLRSLPKAPQGEPQKTIGAPAPIRGGSQRRGFVPSGNRDMRAKFRNFGDENDAASEVTAPGIRKGEPGSGVLMTMSIIAAYPKIKALTDAAVAKRRARMHKEV